MSMASASIEGSIGGSGGSGGSGAASGGSKAISRLIQHSILQLCNEHVQYSHKLQILGVLCMTVDDEQHELVVKVNNTLKRVGPQPQGNKDGGRSVHVQGGSGVGGESGGRSIQMPELQRAPEPVALYNGGNGPHKSSVTSVSASASGFRDPLVASGAGYSEGVNEGEGGTTPGSAEVTPSSTPTPTPAPTHTPSPVENGRKKSNGRKRSKPMRVDHVYDEGDEVDEILTVIPTDPDHPEGVQPERSIYLEEPSDDDDDELMEDDDDDEDSLPTPPKVTPRRGGGAGRGKSGKSTASPNVRALLQQSIARKGTSSDATTAATSITASMMSTQQHSQLRSALLNGPQHQTLTLPICVAPNELRNGETPGDSRSESPGVLHIDEDAANDPQHDDSGVSVKEEPRDEYDWSRAGQVTAPTPTTFAASPFYAIASGIDGVSSIPTYSGLSLALTTANLQIPSSGSATVVGGSAQDGLTIRYTPTGPITVGANGKNVSQESRAGSGSATATASASSAKVKDIIMYNDQSPLSQQKGAILETSFMEDTMGLEGRKRRRRAPDETLTMEEIAEYMGVAKGMESATIGQGDFQCKYCPVAVNELVSYLQHTLSVHNAYICHQCGKSFTTKSSLLRHRPIHTGMRRFSCTLCKKTFYRKDKCKAHIKRHLGGGEGNGADISAMVE